MAKAKKKTAKKKITKKKKDEPKKPDAKTPPAGGFPKIVTEAKIQTVSYDATSGSNLKFKDLSLTSGQFEKLVAIAQDGQARVRISIEEINPKFDAAAKGTSSPAPMFTDLSDRKIDEKTGKMTKKKAAKKTNGKKGTDDGSQLPI